jgi:hypothetical protein
MAIINPDRVDLYSGALMAPMRYADRNKPVPTAASPTPVVAQEPVFSADIRMKLDPANKATDAELQELMRIYPMRGQLPTFQVRPDGTVATGVWDPRANRFSIGDVVASVGTALGTDMASPEQINAVAMVYQGLANPYGNAYMQRLQEQLAGRSEANLQRMNALMSQRGMGGTGLASARALQAQSDVGQQLLGAQQEATQQGAQFALNRLAGMTGQQQFGRQQTEAERAGAASRNLAQQQFGLSKQAQQAQLLGQAAAGQASALGITPMQQPKQQATSTGGGTVKSMPYESFIRQYRAF